MIVSSFPSVENIPLPQITNRKRQSDMIFELRVLWGWAGTQIMAADCVPIFILKIFRCSFSVLKIHPDKKKCVLDWEVSRVESHASFCSEVTQDAKEKKKDIVVERS